MHGYTLLVDYCIIESLSVFWSYVSLSRSTRLWKPLEIFVHVKSVEHSGILANRQSFGSIRFCLFQL